MLICDSALTVTRFIMYSGSSQIHLNRDIVFFPNVLKFCPESEKNIYCPLCIALANNHSGLGRNPRKKCKNKSQTMPNIGTQK